MRLYRRSSNIELGQREGGSKLVAILRAPVTLHTMGGTDEESLLIARVRRGIVKWA
jgi:hypothetical protein